MTEFSGDLTIRILGPALAGNCLSAPWRNLLCAMPESIRILPSIFRRVVHFDEALEAVIVLDKKDCTSVNRHSCECVAIFQVMCRFVVARRPLDGGLSQQGLCGDIQNNLAATRTAIAFSAGLTVSVGLVAIHETST